MRPSVGSWHDIMCLCEIKMFLVVASSSIDMQLLRQVQGKDFGLHFLLVSEDLISPKASVMSLIPPKKEI